jgi:hypothetical protein
VLGIRKKASAPALGTMPKAGALRSVPDLAAEPHPGRCYHPRPYHGFLGTGHNKGDLGLAWASVDHQHGRLHGAGAAALQGKSLAMFICSKACRSSAVAPGGTVT